MKTNRFQHPTFVSSAISNLNSNLKNTLLIGMSDNTGKQILLYDNENRMSDSMIQWNKNVVLCILFVYGFFFFKPSFEPIPGESGDSQQWTGKIIILLAGPVLHFYKNTTGPLGESQGLLQQTGFYFYLPFYRRHFILNRGQVLCSAKMWPLYLTALLKKKRQRHILDWTGPHMLCSTSITIT